MRRSELCGCSHTGEAGSFNLAAWECVPMQTLQCRVFCVVCWPEGTQLPPKEESLMVPLLGFEVPRAELQPD